MEKNSKFLMRLLFQNVLIGLAYFTFGHFSLMLSAPPSNATAVWPPAGVSLALLFIFGYRALPGIFIGEFYIAEKFVDIFTLSGFSIATVFGIQAVLTAWTGMWLVRKFFDVKKLRLTEVREISLVYFLAGPVANVLPALLTIGVQHYMGWVSSADFAFSVFTWWMGGTIGVTIFLPLTLLIVGQPRKLWKNRVLTVGLPLAVLIVAIFTFFVVAKQKEHESLGLKFAGNISQIKDLVRPVFDGKIQKLDAAKFSPENLKIDLGKAATRFASQKDSSVYVWSPVLSSSAHAPISISSAFDASQELSKVTPIIDISSIPLWSEAITNLNPDSRVVYLPPVKFGKETDEVKFFGFAKPVFGESGQNKITTGYLVSISKQAELAEILTEASKGYFVEAVLLESVVKNEYLAQTISFIGLPPELKIRVTAGRDYGKMNSSSYLWWVLVSGLIIATFLGFSLLSYTGRSYEVRKKVKEQREELKALYRASPDIMLLVGPDEEILDFQGGISQLLSGSESTILEGAKLGDVVPHDMAASIREAQAGKEVVTVDYQTSGETGEIINFEVRIIAVRSDQVILIIRDVSKIKRMEEEKVKTDNLLRHSQKMDAIGSLTAGIAHDFNNILAIIQGSLNIVDRSLSGDAKLKPWITRAVENTKRGVRITKRLLRFTSSGNHTDSEAVRVSDIVFSFEEILVSAMTATIAVKITSEENLWMSHINAEDCEDALLNISLNARHAMPDGGKLDIELTNVTLDSYEESEKRNFSIESGEYVRISIADTGSGMSPETLEKLFDPFFTTKQLGEGTGLGLSMVYGFIGRSNARIFVTSKIENGTTFNLYFPRYTSKSNDSETKAVSINADLDTERSILIADSDEDFILQIQNTLNPYGYTVLSANSPKKGRAILASNSNVGLVFTEEFANDQFMGLVFADEVREKHSHADVFLMASSSSIVLKEKGFYQMNLNLKLKSTFVESCVLEVGKLFGNKAKPVRKKAA